MSRRVVFAILLSICLWAATAGAAEITCSLKSDGQEISCQEQAPTRNQWMLIRLVGVEEPGKWQVKMTYRPNSATSQTVEPVSFNEAGEARLKPSVSGIVEIQAEGPYIKDQEIETATLNIPVRYTSPPISGIIILLLAGSILFGGAGYSLVKALKE